MKQIKKIVSKIKCLFGFHEYQRPIIATIGKAHWWAQVGDICPHCKKFKVTQGEIAQALHVSYNHGCDDTRSSIFAYASGLDQMIAMYPHELTKRGYVKVNK